MTCEHCQELISAFLDCELEETVAANVRTHLAVCADCAKVCEDFAMILDFCQLEDLEETLSLPPNPQALWCRINNIIETEALPEIQAEQQPPVEEVQKGWFAHFWANSWQFSLTQVASLVMGIALVSSLLTVVVFYNYSTPADSAAVAPKQPNIFEKFLGKLGVIETPQQARERRIREQQQAIEYWKKRVETRRVQWNAHLREAFDRNLNEINQVVIEYDKILRENPQDDISSEMLDAALTDQMELLREFSEL